MPKNPLEIDVSTLSSNQKKMFVKFLASSNVKFSEKNDNFIAQLRVDSHEFQQQFNAHQQQNVPAPAEQPKVTLPVAAHKPKSKILNGKKPLQKVVRTQSFQKLRQKIPYVQIYIYPKKHTLSTLMQIIQNIYDRFWAQYNQKQLKALKLDELSFSMWVYNNYIKSIRYQIKQQQQLVNLIESLNHYSYKNLGIQIFIRFMEESYAADTLYYFLVLRAIFQQIMKEKILDKSHATKINFNYPIKMNPYTKNLQQSTVKQFLCMFSSDSKKKEPNQEQFQNITELMYYDKQKKKNFIQYFTMIEYLLNAFSKIQEHTEQPSSKPESPELASLLFSDSPKTQQQEIEYSAILSSQNTIPYTLSRQQEQQQFPQLLKKKVLEQLNKMHHKLELEISDHCYSKTISLINSVVRQDKTLWISCNPGIKESDISALQRIQKMYKECAENGQFINNLTKRMLSMRGIRESVLSKVQRFY